MKSCKICIILCALICLSFDLSAQDYTLLKVGASAQYEGVLIRLPEYRIIRRKVSVGDSLQLALNVENKRLTELVSEQMKTISTQAAVISRHAATIDAKDKTISELSGKFDELQKEATKKHWYTSPLFQIPAAVFLGAAVTKLF